MSGPRRKAPQPPPGGVPLQTVFSMSEEETLDLGRTLARMLRGSELILLEGDLGLGKTVLARGIAVGLGVAEADVSSPSFLLIQEYRGGRLPLFHADLYRLQSGDEIATLGLEEIVDAGAVLVVEWGERLPLRYKRDAIQVKLHDLGEGTRRIELRMPAPKNPKRRGDA
ncbi:MAG: tRNA (adenosine(37)-N6)-threonylcarbamoyltransferase complex ATPase subunit type 1 TsaE [bacterium]|nr:tRNA (adenosine(37)-N6)-threonylcarbamoyltransferase complex ATPase subunit type 1 TsaE [bacterium]